MNKKRRQYLEGLAADYGIPEETVFAVADILGPNEDYDGLISMLDDYWWIVGDDEEVGENHGA